MVLQYPSKSLSLSTSLSLSLSLSLSFSLILTTNFLISLLTFALNEKAS